MLDIKFLRENPDLVKENIKKKFQDSKLALVDEVIELDAKSRAVKTEADSLRANRNKVSKEIGALMAQGKKEEAMAAKSKVTEFSERLAECEKLEAEYAEKVTKIMMIALLGLIIVLAIHSFTLDGAREGLKFYLLPSVDKVKEVGLINVIVAAMNQSFFTLSLGIGAMAIFGSFIGKERSLLGEGISVASLDTFVAITSGLIIFPACFTYNVDVGAGPNLIFVTLPHVFMNMSGGRIWGTLFFLFMSFAALSTIFAVFQNILSCVQELTNFSKIKTCILCGIGMFILSIPCVLGFNVWSGFAPLGQGTGILDLEDYIVSNILLPIGSLVVVIFCTQKFGWGFNNYMDEANQGKGAKVQKWMRFYLTYILPVIIGIIAVISIVTPFI